MTSRSRILFATQRPLAKLRKRVISVLAASLALSMPAWADDAADVGRLLRAGQHAEALAKADAFLAHNPRDAQMRFLKGLILAEQNRSAEAIAVFAKLAEDYPALPEPLNNLGVLYAANGQLDKARAAFDAAIRTQPAYAAAYDNLGDVHARLAAQAYSKALRIEAADAPVKSTLALVRTLHAPNGAAALAQAKPAQLTPPAKPAVVTVAQTPASAPAAVATAAVPAGTTAPPKPAPQVPTAKPDPKTEPKPPAMQVAMAKPESKPEPKPEPKPAPQVAMAKPEAKPLPRIDIKPEPKSDPRPHAEREEALSLVHAWAKAWSGQDVKSYLAYYGPDFQAPNGQARKTWEEERRNRIAGKGRISVKVESPEVTVNGNSATVRFRQIYTSDRLTANTRKTLVLARHAGKWLIRQEQTGG